MNAEIKKAFEQQRILENVRMNEAKYREIKPFVSFDFGTKDNSRYLKIN